MIIKRQANLHEFFWGIPKEENIFFIESISCISASRPS